MSSRPMPTLPMPGDHFDGKTVIASVWGNDEPDDEAVNGCTVLTLDAGAPFYILLQCYSNPSGGWEIDMRQSFDNIVPAADAYREFVE